jgi:hypothetical protein
VRKEKSHLSQGVVTSQGPVNDCTPSGAPQEGMANPIASKSLGVSRRQPSLCLILFHFSLSAPLSLFLRIKLPLLQGSVLFAFYSLLSNFQSMHCILTRSFMHTNFNTRLNNRYNSSTIFVPFRRIATPIQHLCRTMRTGMPYLQTSTTIQTWSNSCH